MFQLDAKNSAPEGCTVAILRAIARMRCLALPLLPPYMTLPATIIDTNTCRTVTRFARLRRILFTPYLTFTANPARIASAIIRSAAASRPRTVMPAGRCFQHRYHRIPTEKHGICGSLCDFCGRCVERNSKLLPCLQKSFGEERQRRGLHNPRRYQWHIAQKPLYRHIPMAATLPLQTAPPQLRPKASPAISLLPQPPISSPSSSCRRL